MTDRRYALLVIHRPIPGRHIPTDAACWCDPLVVPAGTPEKEILALVEARERLH